MKSILLKAHKIAGWLLLIVIILYLLTGYSISGRYNFNIIDKTLAVYLHSNMDILLLFLLIIHIGVWIFIRIRQKV